MLVLAAVTTALLSLATGCAHREVVVVAVTPPPAPTPVVVRAPEPPREIHLPGELEFDLNLATIKDSEQSAALLSELASILLNNPRITRLRIEGHTDSVGRPRANQRLSQRRADAVADWLAAHGVDRGRLDTIGYGQSRPLVDNDTAEHRKMNRRTEFHIAEIDGKATAENDIVPAGARWIALR
jgi:OOP family OmpA-OmpF porin